jgi:hypothetical protein
MYTPASFGWFRNSSDGTAGSFPIKSDLWCRAAYSSRHDPRICSDLHMKHKDVEQINSDPRFNGQQFPKALA